MSEPKTVGELVDRLPAPRNLPVAVTPMQMLAMAVEKGASVEMLEKLLALQERWEANEARKAFVHALAAFKANPPTVIKNKHVGFQGRGGGSTEYDHATLDQVCDVIGAALSRHGLSHRWEVGQAEGLVKVTCILTHQMGHSERVSLQAGADASGSKNPIQAIGSTVTYLERYTLLAAVGLAAKGQDTDAHSDDDLITPAQKDELIVLMQETNSDTKRFLAYLGVNALDELPAAKFADAKAALEKKRSGK